jgi:hypothetical protein
MLQLVQQNSNFQRKLEYFVDISLQVIGAMILLWFCVSDEM